DPRPRVDSFPTRRSSDLWVNDGYTARCFSADIGGFQVELAGRMSFPEGDEVMTYDARGWLSVPFHAPLLQYFARESFHMAIPGEDRKSTRLNSSHVKISY